MSLEAIYDKIRDTVDLKLEYLYINNKVVATGKSMKSLKENVKENFENPAKDIKCFIIRLSIKPDYKHKLIISCAQHTVTPKLGLFAREGDMAQTFTYSDKELLKYKFKLSHLKKIMKVIKKDLISYEKSSVPITDVFKALE
jgi:hypothetical protein